LEITRKSQKKRIFGRKIPIIPVDTTFVYPFRATYDFECYFDSSDLPTGGSVTKFLAKHLPVSCSVASNVPEMTEPVCFITTGDPQDLVNRMLDYLHRIADAAYAILKEQFADVYTQLAALDDPRLRIRFDEYLRQLPIIGFNSGNMT
jgi:hypothetical protein